MRSVHLLLLTKRVAVLIEDYYLTIKKVVPTKKKTKKNGISAEIYELLVAESWN